MQAGSAFGGAEPREDVSEHGLQTLAAQNSWKQKQVADTRAAARVRWAYTFQPAYSGCVDWITSAMLCNGEDPEKRSWRVQPALDRNGEAIKNPDESQLEPFYTFVENCSYERTFHQLLAPIISDFVAANTVYAEVALSPILNRFGRRQPGALYLFPQGELYNVIDDQGELDAVYPFAQLRSKREAVRFTWDEVLYVIHGTMRAEGLNPITPIDSIMQSVQAATSAQKFINDYFVNGGRVGQTFKNATWEKEDALAFVNDFTANFLGRGNSHKPFAIWGETEMENLPAGFTEFVQFIGVILASLHDTCRKFQLDPRLISAQNQGSALGNKGERQQVYQEALMGPVNDRKREFNEAFTRQILHQGLGITDWRFELPTYPRTVDTEKIAAVAAGWASSVQSGVVFPKRHADLVVLRKQLDPSLTEITAEELDGMTAPAPAVAPATIGVDGLPAPVAGADVTVQELALNGAQVTALSEIVRQVSAKELAPVAAKEVILAAFPQIPEAKVVRMVDAASTFKPEAPTDAKPASVAQPAPEPPAPEPDPVVAERAKRGGGKVPADVREAREAMDEWTDATTAAIQPKLVASITKSAETLRGIYRNALADGFSDAEKSAFDAWLRNPLPAAGQTAAQLRKLLKLHYKTAKEQALKQIGAAAKESKGRRSPTSDAKPGGIDNFLEAFGEDVFDDLYAEITSTQRKLFLSGLKHGWDVQQFADKVLKRATDVTEAQVKAIIRTSSTDVFNIGRQNAAEEAGLDAYLYSAILDDRTAEVCEKLNGLYLGVHDPAVDDVRPPNHINCRCILSFVLPGKSWSTDQAQLAAGRALIPEGFGG